MITDQLVASANLAGRDDGHRREDVEQRAIELELVVVEDEGDRAELFADDLLQDVLHLRPLPPLNHNDHSSSLASRGPMPATKSANEFATRITLLAVSIWPSHSSGSGSMSWIQK